MNLKPPTLLGSCLLALLLSTTVVGQHLADLEFNTAVAKPAYPKSAPRVMFDEAHFNHHTSNNRYKPFATLLQNDGYRIVVNREPFTKKSLDTFKVVIIVNALGDDIDETDAEKPAFTDDECVALRDWVKNGGALLLISDAAAFAKSVGGLAKYFGVEMSGTIAVDKKSSNVIEYSRENQLLGDHSIMQGRDNDEKIQRVMVFAGQTLKGPADAISFLKIPDAGSDAADAAMKPVPGGASQGLAFKFSGGRVVVLGDAEMLSALLSEPPNNEPIGMNYPDVDNKQLGLNIMHWLSGLIR
jgi:hypothetical protein